MWRFYICVLAVNGLECSWPGFSAVPVLCLEFIEFICSIKILISLIKWNRFANLVKGHMSAFLSCSLPPPWSRATERGLLSQMPGWHQSHMDVITGQGTGSFGAIDLKSWSLSPTLRHFQRFCSRWPICFLSFNQCSPPDSEWNIKTSLKWFSGHIGKKSGRCGCCWMPFQWRQMPAVSNEGDYDSLVDIRKYFVLQECFLPVMEMAAQSWSTNTDTRDCLHY